MNKWQEYYKAEYGPIRSKIAKRKLELLGNVKDEVTIHFPDFKSKIASQNKKAHTETYKVTYDKCNMPKGIVSVEVLAANLDLWTERGYDIEY